MRITTPAFAASLAAGVSSLALCWRVTRLAGGCLGFTTHDRALVVDGLVYAPAPGVAPSAVRASDGFEVDLMEVAGALSGDAITAAELADGRYDGALVELFMVDWEQPEAGRMALARGTLGTVEQRDGAFTAELRGPGHALARVPVELTSPECRAELGDARCRVDLAAHTRLGRVVAVAGAATMQVDLAGADGDFAYGRLRVLDGVCGGTEREIAASVGGALTLREALERVPGAGDRVEVRSGCDKRFATCRTRFSNGANFRGEPHVPGQDALVRYAGV